jgi:hypothetical protein
MMKKTNYKGDIKMKIVRPFIFLMLAILTFAGGGMHDEPF